MNFKKIRSKNDTEGLILSITKNCETLFRQTHAKPEETLEFKLNKQKGAFHFQTLIAKKGSRMIDLAELGVYNPIFNNTEEINKFELYSASLDNEFSYTHLKDNIAEILCLSDISALELEHEIHGPNIIKTYRKLSIEKSQTDGYCNLSMDYVH